MRAQRTPALLHAVSASAALTIIVAVLLMLMPAASADVDDFSYSSWSAEYDISLDADGRAIAKVTETLVAEFPEHDQNKGVIRGYPQRYLGAGLDIDIVSVKDQKGRDVPFEVETEDDMVLVLTGTDDYVHGSTTYVIESTMRDFMLRGTESGNDEFYWNLLPLNSSQDIGRFDAELRFSPALASAATGDAACYAGHQGQRRACDIDQSGDGSTYRVRSGERAAGDGVTVAIGFAAGTVTQPSARGADPVADFGPAVAAALSLVTAAGSWIAVALLQRRRRVASGVVIAQFDVPADQPPLVAASLIKGAPNPVPAQIVHLAVQGALRLEDEGDDRPAVRLLDRARTGHPLDRAMLDALFPGDTTTRRIPRTSTKFAKRMQGLAKKGADEAKSRGWVTSERSRAAIAFGWASLGMLGLTLALLIWTATKDRDLLPLSIIAFALAAVGVGVSAIVAFSRHTVLTAEGAERAEYLLGVREFIRVAETDRLRMLQSVDGAERRREGSSDVVHLYEKLLPYAMLFGEERSWSAVLETAYADSGRGPDWVSTYVGVSLASRLSSYSSSLNTAATYTPPSASSSGGSTGGGFSGGGGGGGFSGGR
ncbi:DUF2207 domain-containing protein [Microbacterium esteraromaticum]|uniref:DUF2207 domain-containing protein n=1 Tax=Microbacterium esteraromaticum TaxID=57043 RepID=UPI00195AEA39|nr:DUF2207 domain-containing protein [Microbacterium esteraromaticum]MBM7466529.1 putative membrane protein YgcG [Microbacterium esteraromaticum]